MLEVVLYKRTVLDAPSTGPSLPPRLLFVNRQRSKGIGGLFPVNDLCTITLSQ